MEKFNRENIKEISSKISDALAVLGEELGIELSLGGGSFLPESFTLKLKGKLLDDEGAPVISEVTAKLAEAKAKSKGLSLEGALIRSFWKVKDSVYQVTDYKSSRRKYPFTLKRSDGKLVKCSVDFLKQGYQLTEPTEEEFYIWLSVDPDSDAVRESDVEIVDKVQDYFENRYGEDTDDFLEMATTFTEKGVDKVTANKIFDKYKIFGIEKATQYMRDVLDMPSHKRKRK